MFNLFFTYFYIEKPKKFDYICATLKIKIDKALLR